MSTIVSKEEAHKLIDQLPANATWDDLMHEIYVRETIEKGLEDSKAGRTKGVADIRKKYGLPEWGSNGRKPQKLIWMQFMST